MKVSVIVPVYNAEVFLRECLDSVLGQTLADIELICVDDGSTDGSLTILREYERADERVIILEQTNRGGGAARNAALERARGEYLAFLDADDYFEQSMLEHMVSAADKAVADVVLCRSYVLNHVTKERGFFDAAIQYIEPGVVFSADDVWDRAFRYCVGWPWDKVFRRSFIERHTLTFQELRSTNDAYFVFIALALAEKIILVDKHLVTHRVGNTTSIENTREKSWHNAFAAMEEIGNRLREEGLYEKAEQSFLNWILDFGIWNFRTLKGRAKRDFAVEYRKKFAHPMAPHEEDFFYEPTYFEYMKISAMDDEDLLVEALSSYLQTKELKEHSLWQASEIDRLKEEIHMLVGDIETLKNDKERIEARCLDLEERRRESEAHRRELEESTSYKVGRAATYLPRKIKDALS